MTATEQSITGYSAGESRDIPVTVGDGPDGLKDLTGATVQWGFADRDEYDPLIVKSSDSDGIDITGDPGTFVIHIRPEDTASLYGMYRHEARVTDASGHSVVVLQGSFPISRSLIPAPQSD